MATGFVGLGNMGWPMAANLVAAGVDLVVRDADRGREAAFVAEHGARVDAFDTVDALITMLPDDRVVASALLEDGLAAALPTGAVVVDMSSSNPIGTRALATRLPDGVLLVDAPVSGGTARAADGTLSIMIGGEDAAVERVQPLLDVLGARSFRAGPLGSGHAIKALNNYLAAAAYAAGTEAILIGRGLGLAPETIVDVVNASTGRSFSSEVVLKEHVLTGGYATGFGLGLLAKDVGIAAALADALDADAPTLRVVSRRWTEAAAAAAPGADHSEAHRHWWSADLAAAGTPGTDRNREDNDA